MEVLGYVRFESLLFARGLYAINVEWWSRRMKIRTVPEKALREVV